MTRSQMMLMGAVLCGLAALGSLSQAAAAAEQQAASSLDLELATQRSVHLAHLARVSEEPETHFRQWAQRHGRTYLAQNDAAELQSRYQIWRDNLAYVLDYNSKHTTHWLGMNSLADLTHDEYRGRYLGFDGASHKKLREQKRASNAVRGFKYAGVDEGALPKAVDWRKEGAVSEVKNQQQCGSCWAFSTTGSIEGINAIFTKELVSLSEQELVDCDTDEDKGCNGGLMDYAFEFVIKNKGLDSEQHYPYTAMEGECQKKHQRHHVVSIDGYEDVPENDEVSLKKAAAHQPVSVAIEADQKAFQLYVGGVFADESCGTELDHGVLVVGYGPDPVAGTYYIVKNSWGGDWGEQGYIRLKANVQAKEGLCGIAMAASYPTKTSPNPPKPGPDPPEPPPSPKGPKPPGPVQCDDSSECPASTTCCCISEFMSVCIQWGCCPIVDAVCCEDHMHCCPPTLPVCDTAGGRCLPGKNGNALLQPQPWLARTPAKRDFGALARMWMKGRGTGSKKTMRAQAE